MSKYFSICHRSVLKKGLILRIISDIFSTFCTHSHQLNTKNREKYQRCVGDGHNGNLMEKNNPLNAAESTASLKQRREHNASRIPDPETGSESSGSWALSIFQNRVFRTRWLGVTAAAGAVSGNERTALLELRNSLEPQKLRGIFLEVSLEIRRLPFHLH